MTQGLVARGSSSRKTRLEQIWRKGELFNRILLAKGSIKSVISRKEIFALHWESALTSTVNSTWRQTGSVENWSWILEWKRVSRTTLSEGAILSHSIFGLDDHFLSSFSPDTHLLLGGQIEGERNSNPGLWAHTTNPLPLLPVPHVNLATHVWLKNSGFYDHCLPPLALTKGEMVGRCRYSLFPCDRGR